MQMQKSADTKIIESVLGDAKVGQVITYDQLSQAIGRDVRAHAIGALGTARRGLLSEKGYVFDVERNVGLVRLDDVGIVKTTESDRRRLQRCANKSLRKLAVVQFDKLDDNNKRQHVVASAQMGTIAMFASKASANKIESQVNGQSKTLAIGETIKLFS